MSVEVSHLVKVFGTQRAVDDISFAVAPGEIVGFLGPNGAGKSTTMKIMTGYLPPTRGSVRVQGLDVATHREPVKRLMGYLPEHNPLYTDLYVHEFLRFSGSLYGLTGRPLRARVGAMIELCGLTREQNKKIEMLSKGYRQRVGLAHALLHDPSVLILDEPTSGLDPNQILEIRKVIREVSRSKTVIFSSHILQEVQALCSRVMVIHQGRLVADSPLADLLSRGAATSLLVAWEQPVELHHLQRLPGVMQVEEVQPGTYRLLVAAGADALPHVLEFSATHALALRSLQAEASSLEDVFRQLTAPES